MEGLKYFMMIFRRINSFSVYSKKLFPYVTIMTVCSLSKKNNLKMPN